jgi:hypothetical protein
LDIFDILLHASQGGNARFPRSGTIALLPAVVNMAAYAARPAAGHSRHLMLGAASLVSGVVSDGRIIGQGHDHVNR